MNYFMKLMSKLGDFFKSKNKVVDNQPLEDKKRNEMVVTGCTTDDGGTMGLVEPGASNFKLISSFKVPLGENQHWAHPVIHDKKLYIRHGSALMVYDIGAK